MRGTRTFGWRDRPEPMWHSMTGVDRRTEARLLVWEGIRWLVYELHSSYDRRSRPDLIFESIEVVPRVRSVPLEWRTLPDPVLWELSWAR